MNVRTAPILLVLILTATACGGSDGTGDAAPTTTAAASTTPSTSAPTTGSTPAVTAAPSTTAGGADTGLPACDSLLGVDEAAELFGEPAEFDAEESQPPPGIAATACVWTSVEDPDDLEDLQVQLVQVHVYRGAQFYAPEATYDDVEQLDGIGDRAFVAGDSGVSAGFLDGEIAAFIDFTVIFPQDAPEAITKRDQVVDLLRLVHERIS
jgi:hypothetical protein